MDTKPNVCLWDLLPEEIEHIILRLAGGFEHREKMQHVVDDFKWFRQVNEDLCREMQRLDLNREVDFDHMDWEYIDHFYGLADTPVWNAGIHH